MNESVLAKLDTVLTDEWVDVTVVCEVVEVLVSVVAFSDVALVPAVVAVEGEGLVVVPDDVVDGNSAKSLA